MKMARLVVFAAFGLTTIIETQAWAQPVEVSTTVETIVGHRPRFDDPMIDAEQSYILIDISSTDVDEDSIDDFDPIAILLLFPGGAGTLRIADGELGIRSTNFLVRTRNHFAAASYIVAVMDAASDFLDLPDGLRGQREPGRPLSAQVLADIEAVINDLRGKFPALPLWAVGTSRGTISAARAAAELNPPPDGLVLTSPLTGPSGNGDLEPVDLESVGVPALIVTNRDDQCRVTKPDDAKLLKKRFLSAPRAAVKSFRGGIAPLVDACGSLSGHGFFGIEQKVVKSITKWIARAER